MDLEVSVNGRPSRGMGVAQREAWPVYDIRVRAPEKVELVTLTTCHREQTFTKQDREFSIRFTPSNFEDRVYCPARISAFSPSFVYAGGFLDFEDNRTRLPAEISCNGLSYGSGGVSVCQSRAELAQQIRFDLDVDAGTPGDAKCPPVKVLDPMRRFEIRLGEGLCVYAFRERNEPRRTHRLTTYGYQEFIVPR